MQKTDSLDLFIKTTPLLLALVIIYYVVTGIFSLLPKGAAFLVVVVGLIGAAILINELIKTLKPDTKNPVNDLEDKSTILDRKIKSMILEQEAMQLRLAATRQMLNAVNSMVDNKIKQHTITQQQSTQQPQQSPQQQISTKSESESESEVKSGSKSPGGALDLTDIAKALEEFE